jgi:peptidoglycan/xylan/chitin deacetylase (PgdA/CDA1 family)
VGSSSPRLGPPAGGVSRQVVISVDLDEWYHCRWATGSPRSRWKDSADFFRSHYGGDRPTGELVEPTRRILELFRRRGVRATFFILGEVATFYPDLVREIAAAGHEIGCHGFHHVDIDLLGPEGFRRELEAGRKVLSEVVGRAPEGYRAPNLLLRDYMIPILRECGFRYDASVCTARSLLGKDFGHAHVAVNPYRFRDRFSEPDPGGDFAEIPLPTVPVLRLPAATGILTRVLGVNWTMWGLTHALRTGDAQYYFHPYEMGGRPQLDFTLRERVFLRRLGPWMEGAVDRILSRLERRGARFVTAGELAARL